ncbi:MAG: hypothetical protein QOI70_1657 [Microbacteriaceae bacterium]|nr:hypothetical protein [Microbacteriaceae bacterium]
MLLPGMADYARVLNPARKRDADIRWNEISTTHVDGRTQWTDVAPEDAVDPNDRREPETGTIDPTVANRLAQLLTTRTATPDECFFLVWEGYAGLRPEVRTAAMFDLASLSRRMHILSGRVTDATESVVAEPFQRLPIWWIPRDGAWCVGNDIYGRSVFVGGSAETISAIVTDPQLEAYAADENQRVVNEDF